MPRYKIKEGSLIRYRYIPKFKKKLLVYDKEPLTIVLELKPDGFYGINLHYLDDTTHKNILDQKITVKDILKSPKILQFIHRYLYSHIQSAVFEYKGDSKKLTRGVFVRK